MSEVKLGYGQKSLHFDFDPDRFSVLGVDSAAETPLTDVEIGLAFDSPISAPALDDLISSNDSVLLVVSDATRATASAQIVNLLVRRLIQAGVSPANLSIIFATGIHRPVSEQEKADLLTPFILQRVRTLTHDAYDPTNLTSLGSTERGVPVEVNRALIQFSKVILIGGIGFHYFAGFTGGESLFVQDWPLRKQSKPAICSRLILKKADANPVSARGYLMATQCTKNVYESPGWLARRSG